MKNSIFHLDTQRAIRVGSVISSNIRFHHSLTSGLKRHYSRKRESHSWARKMIIFQQNFIFPSVICISYGCMYSVFIVVVTTMSPCFAGMKTVAKRGSDEVISCLNYHVSRLPPEVTSTVADRCHADFHSVFRTVFHSIFQFPISNFQTSGLHFDLRALCFARSASSLALPGVACLSIHARGRNS